MRSRAPVPAIPLVHGTCCPLRLLSGMALSTGIRTAHCDREIGARDAQAVILPGVDHHVVLRRHVAGDALCALAANRMVVVIGHIELDSRVAAGTQRIAFGTQFLGMRLVTIHAGHPVLMHPALQERAPDVHLFALLTIGVVVWSGEHCKAMTVFQSGTGRPLFAEG
jgi:hypothetical protein